MSQTFHPSESGPNPAPRAEDEWDAGLVLRDGTVVGAWHVSGVGEGRDEVTFKASVTVEVAVVTEAGARVGMRIVRRMAVGEALGQVERALADPPRTFKSSRDLCLRDFGAVVGGMAGVLAACDDPAGKPSDCTGLRLEIALRLNGGVNASTPDPELRKAARDANALLARDRADARVRQLAEVTRPFLATLDKRALAMVASDGRGILAGCWEGLDEVLPAVGALRSAIEAAPAFPALLCAAWRRDLDGSMARRGDVDRWVAELLTGEPHGLPRWLANAHAEAARAFARLGGEGAMTRWGRRDEDLLGEALSMLDGLPPDWLPRGDEWDEALGAKSLLHRVREVVPRQDLARFLNVGGRWREWAARLLAAGGRSAEQGAGRLFDDAFDVTRAFMGEVIFPAATAARPGARVDHQTGMALLWSGWTLRRVIEHSAAWHARRPAALAAIAALPSGSDRPKAWGAGLPDWSEGGLSLRVLTTPAELLAEGADGVDGDGMAGLSHCVGGYAHWCRAGQCRIASVTGPAPDGGRERLSTVDLRHRRDAWSARQHRGRRNVQPPAEAEALVTRYLERLNSRDLPVDRKLLEPMQDTDAANRAAGYDVGFPGNVEAALRIWDDSLPRGLRGRSAAEWLGWVQALGADPRPLRLRRTPAFAWDVGTDDALDADAASGTPRPASPSPGGRTGSWVTPRLRDLLTGRLSEPHRRHHGPSHVDAMLAGLRELGPLVRAPATVEVAVWYHDAVYDPSRADNESRSADLLRSEMAGVAPPDVVADAAAMVLATADHAIPTQTPPELRGDMAYLLDLDMAVLGADPEGYDAYERGIAAEYGPVHGEAAYARGRRAFLEGLLLRPRLFLTDRFHDELDAKARANVRRAMGGLSQGTQDLGVSAESP